MRRRTLVASAVGAIVLTMIVVALLLPLSPPPEAPSSPAFVVRTLELTTARVVRGASTSLVVEGRSNLVDGAQVELKVMAGNDVVQTYRSSVLGGHLQLQVPAAGVITPGTYWIQAEFVLRAQPLTIQAALGDRPQRLLARRSLEVGADASETHPVKAEFRALFEAVNREPAAPELEELDRKAKALGERLWIARERVAIHKLRLAIREARRGSPRRNIFERHLLEAHVLAGL